MSDEHGFLARWSQRKRQAERSAEAESGESSPAIAGEHVTAEADELEASPIVSAEPTGVAVLPPLESISAETDIRPFMLPNVPAALRQAALRRAWSADPKIRDFVGLADYDWDFNAADPVPGFGPLEVTDSLRRLVADSLSRKDRQETEKPAGTAPSDENRPAQQIEPPPRVAERVAEAEKPDRSGEGNSGHIAAEDPTPKIVKAEVKNSRGPGHGGALPH